MIAQWIGEIVGKMHCNKVTCIELADELGVTNRWLSAILNGHKCPEGAEAKIKAALKRIIERRTP